MCYFLWPIMWITIDNLLQIPKKIIYCQYQVIIYFQFWIDGMRNFYNIGLILYVSGFC